MNFVIIIPARFASSRFPGKPLADIHGKPMIVRVIENTLDTNADKVIVATDSILIQQAIISKSVQYKKNIEVCLTNPNHKSGTERIIEVIKKYQFSDDQIIVNLQGDEPLISPYMINKTVNPLHSDNDVNMATLATPIYSLQEANDNNIVKVVINVKNDALYFSRSVIPWSKKDYNYSNKETNLLLLRHIGIYSYRVKLLHNYVKWGVSPLESYEKLEQLRVLWNGEKIKVSTIDDIFTISVDTPESLYIINKMFCKNKYI